jgi:hypothetical protein
MKIGDLVIARMPAEYNKTLRRYVTRKVLAVITDSAGHLDGTEEYKVYTVDGKHTWSHVDHLTIVEKSLTDAEPRDRM